MSAPSRLTLTCVLLSVCVLTFFILTGCGGGGSSGSPFVTATSISGRVILPESAVLQRRQVANSFYEKIEVWVEQAPELRGFCDEQGFYLISGLVPDTAYNVIACWHSQVSDRIYLQRSAAVSLKAGQTGDAGELMLEPGENRLALVIRDLYGNPIANANVTIWGMNEVSDWQGRLATPALPASVENASVQISAAGFTSQQADLPIFAKDCGPLLEVALSNLQDARRTPLVSFASLETTVSQRSEHNLQVLVTDPDQLLPANFKVEWAAVDGLLTVAADTRSAIWRAPSQDGLASVSAAVSVAGINSRVSIGFAVGGSYQVNARVTEFSPTSAASGQTVSIKGYGFGSQPGSSRVSFAGAAAEIVSWSDEEIKVVVPVAAETGLLIVETDGKQIEAGTFTVIDYAVTMQPLFGPPGTTVVISGYGFGDAQGESSVTLHGTALPVLKWTNTRVEAEILHSSHSGSLALVIRGRTRPVADYVVTKIEALTPERTTRLTDGFASLASIEGEGFGDEQGDSLVEFNDDQPGYIISWSDAEIIVEVPFAAKSGELILTINGVSILTPRLSLVYHDTYDLELAFSGPLLESHPLLPGIALAKDGDLLITDLDNGWLWKYSLEGEFIERIGTPGSGDGQFWNPWGIAVDSAGNIFVADEPDTETAADGRLQKLDVDGNFIKAISVGGAGPGELDMPLGICCDSADNVYVADSANNRIQKFDNQLQYLAAWGIYGTGDGEFDSPAAVAIVPDGKIYVADRGNNRIQEFAGDGTFLRWYGLDQLGNISWKSAGSGLNGRKGDVAGAFWQPSGVFVAADGFLYVSDTGNNRLQKIDRTSGAAAIIGAAGSNDGQFLEPVNIIVSGTDVLVADTDNSRVQIVSDTGDFRQKIVPDTSSLNTFFARLAFDRANDLIYALDRDDGSVAVFDAFGNLLRRIGSSGSGAGQLLSPNGLAVDSDGSLLVADTGNARIVRFSSEGQFLMSFGVYGTGEGQFRSPERVAVNSQGDILVSDYLNNCLIVFSSEGEYQFSFGSSGSGNGQFEGPLSLATGKDNSIYVVDSGNSRVEKFSADGTFIGWLGADETGNAGWHNAATVDIGVRDVGPCRFLTPTDLALDEEGCVYVIDGEAKVLQKFGPDHAKEDFAHHVVTFASLEGFIGLSLDYVGNLYTVERDQQIRRYIPSLAP